MTMSQYIKHYHNYLPEDQASELLNLLITKLPWTTFAPSLNSRKVLRYDPCMYLEPERQSSSSYIIFKTRI